MEYCFIKYCFCLSIAIAHWFVNNSHSIKRGAIKNSFGAVYIDQFEEFKNNSLEELELEYEDEINSLIAFNDDINLYDETYEDMDDRIYDGVSMNVILFGPASWFMRVDPETVMRIFSNVYVEKIPISRVILAWDVLTDGKTAAYLQAKEFEVFGRRLNVVPEEDLYYTNFGDLSVLQYFGKNEIGLQTRKLGILVSSYKRFYGNIWYTNASYIDELGYLMCGFPYYELNKITPKVMKDVSVATFNKLSICTTNQSQTIYNIAEHPDAFGKPYKWLPHEVSRLGWLITCIPIADISFLRLEAIASFPVDIINKMHISKLRHFTRTQILRMNPPARRYFILRLKLNEYDYLSI